ncbi:MAG: type II secretory pathway component [Gammaproteobacteria bacterium]|nr:type II secretory pathway component [Gammaproteobacteria bacterium]MBU1553296.1 type II secretory pathway component [Gammaproteobacteria bacterium]MBU2070840.1 type II secretory pathway component [Gammaproteobacteria bacterium]MBU2182831.1 type II secretory pathway component [Gammaproteobacteria bacterium]MBU2203614.1 type II secretory pathway component [Gammaproteobacteria bacterium]
MYPNFPAQRGSALVIAVFIIVVMLALVLSLSRLLISSSEAVVYEVQGTRTLFAAQSGLELALPQLFPLNGSADCSAVNLNHSFSGKALQGCTAQITCNAYADPTPGASPLYRLSSSASCDAGDFSTSRTVQVEVR